MAVMLRLTVKSGPDEGREAILEHGSRIGRSPASGLRLSDASISREHASIERRDGRWFLKDEGSTNGVWDGKEQVPSIELQDGQNVRIGEVNLSIEIDSPAPSPPPVAPAPAKPAESIQIQAGGGAIVEDDDVEIDIEWADESAKDSSPQATPSPAAKPAVRDLQRDELLRNMQQGKSGLAQADLSQLPVWMRAVLLLAVLAGSCGVFWGVMQMVRSMRG
jgi:predicted component of type VI protein secretion system